MVGKIMVFQLAYLSNKATKTVLANVAQLYVLWLFHCLLYAELLEC